MEGPENERDQAKNVKMHGARSVPSADKNEQADEEIEQSYDSEVVLGCKRLLGRRRENRGFEFLSPTGKLVMHPGPKPRTVQPSRDFGGSSDWGTVDPPQNVNRAYSGAKPRGIGGYPA